MRNHHQVSQREYQLDGEHYLISRTGLKSRITYANPAFIEVSGYTLDELIGAPHSIERHPDMPARNLAGRSANAARDIRARLDGAAQETMVGLIWLSRP